MMSRAVIVVCVCVIFIGIFVNNVSSNVINAYAYRDAMRAEAQKAKDHARELKDSVRPYRYRYPDNWSYGTVYHSSYPTWSFYDVFEDDMVMPSSSGNFIPGTNFA